MSWLIIHERMLPNATPTNWACQTSRYSGCEKLCYFGYLCSDLILLVRDNCPDLSDVSVYVPNSGFHCCHGEVRRMTRMRKGSLKGCCRAFFQVLEKVFQVFWLWSGKAEEDLWKEWKKWMKEISLTHTNTYKPHLTPSSPAYVHASSHWVPLVGTTCIPIIHSHRNSRRCALLYHWSSNTLN